MLNIGTLFSGVGTPELALDAISADYNTLFACEIDKYARITYQLNNKPAGNFYEDIYELDGNKYKGSIDILIGGSPCQSFSLAGSRKGIRDERGTLIYEYHRIVRESKPKVFIYENVKGFVSIDKGRTFTNFVQSLEDMGYNLTYKILNTANYGVPHNRERIYIVGVRENVDLDFSFAEEQELKLSLSDMLEEFVPEKFDLKKELVDKNFLQKDKEIIKTRLNHTHTYNIKGNDSIKRIYSEEGLCPALTTMGGGHREPKVAISFAQRGRYDEDKNVKQRFEFRADNISNSITTVQKDSYVHHNMRFRKLTPRECFNLQGFGQDFEFPEKMSNSQLYKQAGNGMSRNILEMIFRQILKEREI